MKQLLILASLLCTACSDRRPAAPTAAESAQLNDADAMLNQVGKEEGPPRAKGR